MTFLAAIMPFLMLAALLCLLWLLGSAGEKVIGRLRLRTQRKIFYVYAALLLAAPFVYEWLPEESTVEALSAQETTEQLAHFRENVAENREKPFETWSLSVKGSNLSLMDESLLYGNKHIFIREKPAKDGIVDVALYTKIFAGGLDLSANAVPPDVSLTDGSLRVVYSQDLPEARYSLFVKEHVISQFTGGNYFTGEDQLDQNEMVFLITVPAGMTVTAENAAYLN